MYGEELRPNGRYDYDLRRQRALDFFKTLEPNKTLVFYYANYSNPFSEGDVRRYAIVGISRLKSVGDELFYPNASQATRQKFGGAFVWQRNITSHYPDQGFRLPYHLFRDQPDVLENLLVVPENDQNFKYATRVITDDDALGLVERLRIVASELKSMGDHSEDWGEREEWLDSTIAELWQGRGLYPGLATVLDLLNFHEAIPFLKGEAAVGREREVRDWLFEFLDERRPEIPTLHIEPNRQRAIIRQWKLRSDDVRRVLRDVLPRFELTKAHMDEILGEGRSDHGITASLSGVADNPYVLSEQFVGADPADRIAFRKIDHGMFPSPELGGEALIERDGWERLRALCVDHLRNSTEDTFVPADEVIHGVNEILSSVPQWKRHQFTERYLEVDAKELDEALVRRRNDDARGYLYLRDVFEDEREVERVLRMLAERGNIEIRTPINDALWRDYLTDPNNSIRELAPSEYEHVIATQALTCQKMFHRPLSVVTGAAGTGKTTVIRALTRAIERAHGSATAVQLLAPTGKAAERIRERTGRSALTIHSFLASLGWLNDNLTFRRTGGKREARFNTYVIDEASMMDLQLFATLVRSIDWAAVQRLILVGDANQLPPIGRGRVFADLIHWLEDRADAGLGILTENVRQLENRVLGQGTTLLDLSSFYTRPVRNDQDESQDGKHRFEGVLEQIQQAGDVDKDLPSPLVEDSLRNLQHC